ncbi:NADPH:quinone oxidoreductase family protein [Methylobacterium phyllosphaerae]
MQSFQGDIYGSLDAFRLIARTMPDPASNQVRLRVEATALGFVDGLLVEGRYQIKPPIPYVPGGEIAGVVDAVGAGVQHLTAGDRVITWQLGGGLAEYTVVAADEVEPIPANLRFESAAAMLVDYQTAQYALFERGQVKAGETVLVAGAAGGVGSAAVQLAARAGAYVIAATSTPEKRDRAIALGAQVVINSASDDIRAEIRAAAPRGVVDVVVDPVGGMTFEALFRSLAKEGRHLVIGFAGGSIPALPANLALLKSAALVGVDIRHFQTFRPQDARAARGALFAQVASGALAAPQIVPFRLAQAREALAATSHRERIGKIVVLPGN